MLYNKKKRSEEKRSYEYLSKHDITGKAKKRRKKGKVMLSGKQKTRGI